MIFIKKKDLRKSERFYPEDDAYIVFSPDFIKRGPIVNISEGGLACLYFIDMTVRERRIERYANIRCGTFTMAEIPFKIVADYLISDNIHGGQRIIRKRSILFCDLDTGQKKRIDSFLEHHTKRPLTDYRKKTDDGFNHP